LIVFDIETGPLPTEQIKDLAPVFSPATKHPGEFNPAAVKLGQLKDPAKIEAKIEDARQKHAKAVEDFAAKLEQEESDYWQAIMDRAALSAITGHVLAIGYRGAKTVIRGREFSPDNEADLLVEFWGKFKECQKKRRPMVGFYSNSFDVPFLYQRSLILSVDVPSNVVDGGQWLNKTFVDLKNYWCCGNRSIGDNLDTISRAFGIPGKPDGISGKDFSRLYLDPETEHIAIDYLIGDLEMTWQFACRCGLDK